MIITVERGMKFSAAGICDYLAIVVIHKDYSHVIFSLNISLLKCSVVATEYKMRIFFSQRTAS